MALRLRIVNAAGVTREISVVPGEVIKVAPGERITLVDARPEDVTLVREGDMLVVRLRSGETYPFEGMFSAAGEGAPAAPGAKPTPETPTARAAAPTLATTREADSPPTLLFGDGTPLDTAGAVPLGGSTLVNFATRLPEFVPLPEDAEGSVAAAQVAGSGGVPGTSGGSGESSSPSVPPDEESSVLERLGSDPSGSSVAQYSVSGASATEGGILTFTVTRTGDLGPATLGYTLSDGTASLAGDLSVTGPTGTISFASGESTRTITVQTANDAIFEASESITLTLSNPSAGGVISAGTASGTILDDDPAPVVSITGGSANEGTGIVFTISRTGDAQPSQTITFTATVAGGDTGATTDFPATTGTVTFAQGETEKLVTVGTTQDLIFEPAQTFSVVLSGPTNGAVLGAASAQGTILDDDAAPQFSISAAAATEGSGIVLTITRTVDADATQTVDFATTLAGGDTAAPGDFSATAGTVTFTQGQLSRTITIATTQDIVAEPDETLTVEIANATGGASIASGGDRATGTILNDDVPGFAIAAATSIEGGALTFTVTRTRDTLVTQTIEFSTTIAAGDTAGASDFTAGAGTLTFAPGSLVQTFTVASTQEALFESDERFTAVLSNPTLTATIDTVSAAGTIQNDEAAPVIGIGGAAPSDVEGNALTFTLTRSLDAQADQTVRFRTTLTGGDSAATADFTAVDTTVTFVQGELTKLVTVATAQDIIFEPTQTFSALLSNATGGAVLGTTTAQGSIVDDEPVPAFGVAGGSAVEGNDIVFTISRSADSENTQTVEFATTLLPPGSAAPGDFTAAAGTLTFSPGELSRTVTISTTQNTIAEGNKSFTVALSGATGGAFIATPAALGTIIDDDIASFIVTSAAAAEGDAITFTVTRTADAASTQTVQFATTLPAGSTASAGDFTGTAGTLTFTQGVFARTFTVATTDDVVFEPNETFGVVLTNPTNGALIGTGSAQGTINNDEAAPSFAIADPSGAEGSVLTFTVTRTGDAQPVQTVRYNTTLAGGDTASAGDFTGASGTLTFNQGETTKTFTVATTADTVFESDESFSAQLSGATGGAVIGTVAATATIANDDPAPSLSVGNASSAEGGALTFTVTRSGDAQADQTVVFNTTLTGFDTASAGDFTASTGTLTFSAGQLARTFTVQSTQDAVFEANETLTAELSNATGGATIATGTATGTITNDEALPAFSVAAASGAEGSVLTFSVTRSVDAQATQTVEYSTNLGGGSTAAGGDFTAESGTLTFATGELVKTFTVQSTQDALFEGAETFGVALTNPTGGAGLGTDVATGTITNDDAAPSVAIAAATDAEGAAITFTVTRTGDAQATQTVQFATTLGGANPAGASDFTAQTGTLTFSTGETVKTFTVQTTQDAVFENSTAETFTVALSNPTAGLTISTATAGGTITDDEPVPAFTIGAASALEGGAIVFTVTRSVDAQATQTVQFNTTIAIGDSAEIDDFTATSGTLTFVQGQSTQTFTVQTGADAIFEVDETFTAQLSNPTGGAAVGTATATGTITNDEPVPAFSIASASAVEGDLITFTVTRSFDAQDTQTVVYATSAGTAAQGGPFTDYVAAGSTLTFAPGELSKTFSVLTVQDGLAEGNEAFSVTLSSPTAGAILGTSVATGTIIDDDVPSYSVGAANATEGSAITFTVTRTLDPGVTQTVEFNTTLATGNTATGDDFTGLAGTLTFNPGSNSQTFTVATTADAVFETDETLTVELSNATGGPTGAAIGVGSALGTIQNDEAAPSFAIADPTGAEGSVLTFTVTRTGDAQPEQTVRYNTTLVVGDTASVGDFTGGSGTLTFSQGETAKTFTVTTTGDTIFEGDETFTAQLSSATGGAVIGTAAAQATITNDDPAPSLAIGNASATEGGALTFTVTRTGNAQADQTVEYATTLPGGSTADGADFTSTNGTLTFATGETTKTFTVQSTQDALFEAGETFGVALSGATGGATISTATATGTITNDEAVPAFSVAAASIAEGGVLTFTVTRSVDAQADQTVEYSTTLPGGSTAAVGDFTGESGTLTFVAGELVKTFTVQSTQDALFEADEALGVVLANPTGGAILGTATATGTITNDDAAPSVAIAAAGDTEGSALTFTVTRTGDAQATQTVQFATTLGGANPAGASDFTAQTGTLTFSTGETVKTFTVQTTQDALFEDSTAETFTVALSNPTAGLTIGTATAGGSITDDEAVPAFTIAAAGATEGGVVTFTVSRSVDAQAAQTVQFATTVSGTALSNDFTAGAGTLTFVQGESTRTFTVQTTQDAIFEGDETFSVALSNATGGATVAPGTAATGTITNDDAAPSFAVANQSTGEGGILTFTVTRTGDSEAAQTVEFNTSAGSATVTDDFTATSGTLTFGTGETVKTFTVQTVQDALAEGNETLGVQLANATGGAVIGTAAATGTIVDDDIPFFSLAGNVAVGEGAVLTFTVTRDRDSTGTQTVQFATTLPGGSTAGGGDFTAAAGTLTFVAGETAKTFTVQTTQDVLFEGNETLGVVLSNAQGGPAGANIGTGTATGTINNDDAAPVLSVGAASSNEGSALTFTVTRTGDAQAAQTVQFTTSSGTATEGTDYAGTTGTLTFTQGQTARTFTVATTQDTLFEPNETLNVTLSSPGAGATLGTSSAIGNILNDDPVPNFSFSSVSGTEGAALTFTVTRSHDAQPTQTVQFATTLSGTALSNDFTTGSGVLTFSTGELVKTFTVQTATDAVFEANETFGVVLSNATGGAAIGGTVTGSAAATGTINNDDPAPVVSIASASAGEGGTLTFTVNRSGDSQTAQTAQFSTTITGTDNASAGDFTATTGTLTFSTGETVKTFTVAVAQDVLFEGNETLTAALGAVNLGSVGTASATGTLIDDDAIPTLSIAAASAAEGSALTFTVTRTADSQAAQTVEYLLSPSTASEGTDYTDAAGTLTFATGQLVRTFTVATTQDALFEGNETLNAFITGPSFGSVTTGNVTGTIVDDEAVPAFSIAAAPSTEGGALTFTVTRSTDAQATQTVQYATSAGTATIGDFTPAGGVLTFVAGDTTKTFTVQTNQDSLFEGNETLSVQLSNASGGATITGPGTATGTVVDDDAVPAFSIAAASAGEGGIVTFTVTRTSDAQATQTVVFTTSTGSATQDTDYTGTTGTLTFATGTNSRTFTVQTTQDLLAEGNETFTATLSNATGGATLGTASALGTVVDDDIPTFSVSTASASEGGVITFTVTRSLNAPGVNQTVQFATTLGGATAGAGDFTANAGTLTFGDGVLSRTFTVQTTADALFEADETFSVVLSNPAGGPGANIGTGTALGTILNDEAAPSFAIAAASASEGGIVTFTVTRTGDAQAAQTVEFATSGSSAAQGTDYAAAAGTLTFATGEAVKTFTVQTTQDALFEGTETFSASLSNATAGAVIGTTSAVGTITDDDAAPSFAIAAASAAEGAALTFTVTRTGDAQATQTVQFSTTLGGGNPAGAGDFTATTGTLTFSTGETTKTFTVQSTADNVFEGNETFSAALSNATAGATIGTATATGTINNDEAVPAFTVAAASVAEGGALTFTVTRSVDAQATQTVQFNSTLAGGDNASAGDFTANAGTLTFTQGELTKTFTVQSTADAVFEANETLTVQLSGATGGATVVGGTAATGTINNDEAAPAFSMAATNVAEGGILTFTVTRSVDAQATQTVQFNTTLAVGNTASAGDFTARTGALTFVQGELAKTFTVQTTQDAVFEGNETLTVELSGATGGASISTSNVLGTIDNDEAIPAFTVAAASAAEGGIVTFTVTRSVDAQATQTVQFNSTLAVGNTAAVGDFTATAGTLTFVQGESSKTFTVQTTQDTVFEADESFSVNLSAATGGATVTAGTAATGTINNDEAAPAFSIANASGVEGTALTFTVTRSGDAQATQTVQFATTLSGAAAADDFTTTTGTLTFSPAEFTKTFTVQTTQDAEAEGTQAFSVTLTAPSNGAVLGTATAQGSIIDDDIPIFSVAASNESEGGVVTFTITRDRPSIGGETVDFRTTLAVGNTASVSDFTARSGTVTFGAGNTQTFTVQTTQDTLFEGDETFNVEISNVQGGPAGGNVGTAVALGTIQNDEAAPSFAITDQSVNEGGVLTFTVTRTGDAQATQTVQFGTSNGTARTEDSDYTASLGTLTFATGVTIRTFTVQATQDALFEGDETFTATLSGATAGAVIGTASATGTINNEDAAPSFAVAGASVAEGGVLTFTVTRTGDAQATQTVEFTTTLAGGDTAGGGDFTARTGTLTFATGVTTRTFTVQSTQDAVFEANETFSVDLTNATAGATIGTATATGTITNDEATPAFSIAAASATEGGVITFTVTRSVDAQADQTVQFRSTLAVGNTAGAGDFTAETGTLTFTQGVNTRTFTVQTTQDTVFEGNETLTAELSGATGGATITTATALGTINNDDAVPSFSVAAANDTEGAALTFTVTRSVDAQATQTVHFATTLSGTAAAGDFTANAGTLTFAQGEFTKTFTVQSTADAVFEADETFGVVLSGATGGATIGTATANGTIDNDEATPSLSIAAAAATEGGVITFTVTRSVDAQADQTVLFRSTLAVGDTAGAGDFTATTGTLTFVQGQLTRTFTVQTTQDAVFEANETLTAELSGATGGATITTATATGTINNDEAVPAFSIAASSATEAGVITFTVTRSVDAQATQTVDFATSHGTAGAADYTATSGTLTFTTGVNARTFTVQTTSDLLAEGNEAFTVTLTNATGGATLGAASAQGTIVDDDVPVFSVAAASESEGGVLTFAVSRSLNAPGVNQTVQFNTTLAVGNSAGAGDFTASGGTLTFGDGVLTQTFTVQTTQDALFEPDETLTVELSNAAGGPGASIGTGTALGTIQNDEAAPSFAITDQSVNEGGVLTFTVTRTGDAQATQTVQFGTTLSGTAAAGDFTTNGGTLTFATGVTTRTFTVQTTQDALFEGDETFTATLSGATAGAVIGTASATGTINNEDAAPSFAVAGASVAEGGVLTFTVTRTGDAQATQTVEFNTTLAGGDTAGGGDFTARTGTLTFATGVTTRTFTVQSTQDAVFETNETFSVDLTNATAGATIGTASANGTITNDEATPAFSIAAASVTEGGVITFTVTRSVDAQVDQTVQFRSTLVVGNTAGVGDFTAETGTLTFTQGVNTRTFTVQTTQDTVFEANETLTAELSGATGGATITTATALGTINNDDAVPAFSLAAANDTEGAALTFTVTRSVDAQATQTVQFATTLSGTAAAGDFTANAGTLTFAQGEFAKTFTVQSTADAVFEGNETFGIVLTNATGGATIGTATANGTIDNDEATPSLSIAAAAATEGGVITFTVTRSVDAQATQTVQFGTTLAAGTAEIGDFTATAGTLTFVQGQLTRTFTVQTTADTVFETNETFTVNLTSAIGGATIGTPSATGTINNDEAAPLFSIGAASATEGGTMTFTVTRTGSAEDDQTVEFATADNASAIAGSDYTARSGTLTFSSGVTTRTFTVATLQDVLTEGNETFDVALSNPTGGAVLSGASSTAGIILDDDVPTYSIASTGATEGGVLTFVVTRDLTGAAQTIEFETTLVAGNTASAGDFTATSGTLTFGTSDTTQTFTVQTTQDAIFEPNETLTAKIFNVVGGAGGSISTGGLGTGTINNDEAAPSVAAANASVGEGGVLTFTVTRTGNAQATQTVNYATTLLVGNTASAGDFTGAAGALSFATGESVKTFTVQTTADTLFEAGETLGIQLSNATGGATISGAGTATGTITNDDAAPTLSVAAATAAEGGILTFTVTRSADAQPTQTVQFNTTIAVGDTASAGDFTSGAGTLTFVQGQTTRTFTVASVQDAVFEGNETLTVDLSNAVGGATISAGSAAGTITNDDAAPSFAIAASSTTEAGIMTFTVTRTGDAQATQTVQFNSTIAVGNTASSGDFTAAAGTLTFTPGVTARTFTVQTTTDALFESSETLTAQLSNATGGALIGTASALGTITDDDPAPSFAVAAATATEGGVLTFTVTRTGDAQATQTVQFNSTIAGGNTAAVADFTAAAGTLTFTSGVSTRTFTVQTTQDAIYETGTAETLTVQLAGATGGATIGTASATGSINDDDAAPVMSISAASATEGGALTFTVTRSLDAQGTQTVLYGTTLASGNGAAEVGDFTAGAGTLTFVQGQLSRTFTIASTQDAVYEGDETFTAQISGATGGATIGTAAATGTIVEDDSPPVFTVSNASGTEGGAITFTVTKSSASEMTHTVVYATAAGSAQDPEDYTGTGGTLTFASGTTTQTFTVDTTQDAAQELNETFGVPLSNPSNGATVGANATGTIVDDDTPAFSIAAANATEGGVITFVVTRTLDAPTPLTIEYATTLSGDSASVGDFTPAAGTLTFAVGSLTQTFTVATTVDSLFEGNETLTATIFNASGSANIATGTAQGTIVDDDPVPVLSVAAVSGAEGTVLTFTVTRTGDAQVTQTVQYATTIAAGDTAIAGDLTAASGVLTFTSGVTARTFTVATTQDALLEANETFTAQLSNPTGGATLNGGAIAQGTINNDDTSSFAIAAATATEGGTLTFTVTRTGDAALTQTVQFATTILTPNTASAGDFTASSGTLTFTQGQTTRTFTVATVQDSTQESNETFTARLSAATGGATIATSDGTGTITDDDTSTAVTNIALSSLNGTNGFQLSGRAANDNAGFAVTRIGDFNGDGIDDIAIGAEAAELNAEQQATDRGLVYVLFGKTTATAGQFAADITLDTTYFDGTKGFILRGGFSLDHAGYSLAGGDFNADGFSDLLIGVYGTAANRGRAYLVYGHDGAQTPLINLTSVGTTEAGFQLIGPNVTFPEQVGRSVANLGDIDGDGIDDFAVGAPMADLSGSQTNDQGRVYIVYGSTSASNQTLDTSFLNGTNGFILNGVSLVAETGTSVQSAGDINGDGRADFIIGAPGAARAYVVFGAARGSMAAETSLNSTLLNGTAGFTVTHSNTQTQTGFSVAGVGDVNGDGYEDFVVGTPDSAGLSNGNAFLVFGRASWSTTVALSNAGVNGGTNPDVEGIRINPKQLNDDMGISVAPVGDINGDGFADILIGASRNDLVLGLLDQPEDYGQAYVLYGKASGWANTTFGVAFNGTNGFSISGEAVGGSAGRAVSAAGDLNNDGHPDFIVSAPGLNGSAGAAYVIFGGDFRQEAGGTAQTLNGDGTANLLIGGSGNDTINGAGGDDRLLGGLGADVIDGGAGVDYINAGGDDDRVNFDPSDRRVDGGTGIDTLLPSSSGQALNFTALTQNRFTNFEKIDLRGNGNNVLTLTARDLLDLAPVETHALFVQGDAGDRVVSTGQGWTAGGTVNDGGVTYQSYSIASSAAQLYVQLGMDVSQVT